MMKLLLLTLGTTLLTATVFSNAYYKKQQFYPTMVYLLNSNRAIGVMYLQAFLLVWVTTNLLKRIFFGTLRAAEIEHLVERSWYAVLETFILLAAFHHDLSVGFVAMVTILFILKSFHWLAEDRIDYMERSPVITWSFHARAVALLLFLGTIDSFFIHRAWNSLVTRGTSVEIVYGLEYAIMLLGAVNVFVRYVLHTFDLQSEDPWENKAIYLRYVDIFIGFFKLILYVSYMAFMMWIRFIPLHIARRIYITAKNFQKSIHDVISSHQAIRNLNNLYPDATPEELETANNVCIICREEMVARCKKLPCNHIFHTACLRSWFQRQQTCPTCRMDILNQTVVSRLAAAQANRRGQQGEPGVGGRPPQAPLPGHPHPPPPMMFPPMMAPPMWPGMAPHPPPPTQQPVPPSQQQQGAAGEGAAAGDQTDAGSDGSGATRGPLPQAPTPPPPGGAWPHPMMMAPPFFPPPHFMPLPFMGAAPFSMPTFGGAGAMPTEEALKSLSDEDLRSLEGMERANVEARIALLRNVQRLLDGAVAQLNQYSAVMAAMGPAAGPGFPGFPPPPSAAGGPAPAASSTAGATPTPPTTTGASPTTDTTSLSRPQGLFGSSSSSDNGGTPLMDSPRTSPSFSVAPLSPEEEEREADGSATPSSVMEGATKAGPETTSADEVKSKFLESPVGHVDMEIRQRRLQRFYSLPASSTLQGLEAIREGGQEEEGEEGEEGEERRTFSSSELEEGSKQ